MRGTIALFVVAYLLIQPFLAALPLLGEHPFGPWFGVARLPLGVPVELEITFEVA